MGAHAGPLVSTESPIGFFTNVANRLLQSELGLSLSHIQVYPTNEYTPAVHRLLQVTANLYDSVTNRPATGYPYLPSVFRPVFATQGGPPEAEVFIRGYEEVTDDSVLSQRVVDLGDPEARQALEPHDMVYGVPLVIGAKKGYPNFNEFALRTHVRVTRKLQFRRQESGSFPIAQTNQMFLVGISNVLGVEAWNSYATNFNRPLELHVWPDIRVVLTNELGTVLASHWYNPTSPPPYTTNTWPGWLPPLQDRTSFIIPLSNNVTVLTNSAYRHGSAEFVPAPNTFEQMAPAFYVPHWWLDVKARLRFAMVDTSVTPGRIVDYVNLADQNVVNLTEALTQGGQCGEPYTPSASNGSLWCTSHWPAIGDETLPTYGILNQILISLGYQPLYDQADWSSAVGDFPPGMSRYDAVDFFRCQFRFIPIFTHPPGMVFYRSNIFNAPFQPFRNIYLLTSWQANDPLVHYTLSDLTDPLHTRLALDRLFSTPPDPVVNLGQVNYRYEPWGGNPIGSTSWHRYDLALKDPPVARSDAWDFPDSPPLDAAWLGRVHRGTPWQTLYLKTPAASLDTWVQWTGDNQLVTNRNGVSGVTWDAAWSHPTNDWRLASLLASLFNTKPPGELHSVNQPGVPAWRAVLDGITVLTNPPAAPLEPVVMASNSPQAGIIAAALDAAQASQPGHYFRSVGDILATPELSTNSPWLDLTSAYPWDFTLTDAAFEAIPAQLLTRLRPDSVGSVRQTAEGLQVQFTGAEGWAYGVQTSPNLLDWTSISTNYPTNGVFSVPLGAPAESPRWFYRSVLAP